MRKMNTAELRELQVINLCGGECLGYPCDFEIDLDDGRILALTVTKSGKGFSLFAEKEEYLIPWCRIECVGEDAILVKLPHSELCTCAVGKTRKKFK